MRPAIVTPAATSNDNKKVVVIIISRPPVHLIKAITYSAKYQILGDKDSSIE